MKIPQYVAWPAVIFSALVLLGLLLLVVLNPVPTFGGGYSCDFRLATMRQAAEDVVNGDIPPGHTVETFMRQKLADAQFDCGWDDRRFRCRTVNK